MAQLELLLQVLAHVPGRLPRVRPRVTLRVRALPLDQVAHAAVIFDAAVDEALDGPRLPATKSIPRLSGEGGTARPFCHGWCQWVVWGCSSAVIPHRTARPQTRECKWGAMCNMRQGAMRARRPGGGVLLRTSVASSLVTPEVVSSGSETGRGNRRGTVEFWGSAEPPPYIYEEKVEGGFGRVMSRTSARTTYRAAQRTDHLGRVNRSVSGQSKCLLATYWQYCMLTTRSDAQENPRERDSAKI